ncbi:hypothetical protein DEMA109039_01995 [Deinococcus marmoris]
MWSKPPHIIRHLAAPDVKVNLFAVEIARKRSFSVADEDDRLERLLSDLRAVTEQDHWNEYL